VRIEHIYISPGHNFFGHHGKPPGDHPIMETEVAPCVAGKGIVGDRFFDYKKNYRGQITFFSCEVYRDLCRRLQVADKPPAVFRRNIVTRGIDLNTLIGSTFWIQGIEFTGIEECRPCYWMDQAFAPGTEELLKGRGGLRARIATDGVLRKASLDLKISRPA
jgi:MOSC domain-containing protein YiiM